MKTPYVGELVASETVTAHFLVLSKEIRQKKTGEPYLSLILGDKTGEVEAKMWDNVPEVLHAFDRDDFIKAKGFVQPYQNRVQFTIHKLRKLAEAEIDLADYFPCADRDVDEMWRELEGTIASVGNLHLRALLYSIFSDQAVGSRFRLAPAAKHFHHACRGGLLQHVLSMCSLARLIAPHYGGIDLDLVLAGALLHDIGKLDELTYSRSFGYTIEGQLLGHITMGVRLVGDRVRELPDFPPRLRTLLEHMILSHHGELEYGSPKIPLFPEALLLHHLDNLDSKMAAMRTAIGRERQSTAEFTAWVPALERAVLRKEAYLHPAPLFEQPVAAQIALAPGTLPLADQQESDANTESAVPGPSPESGRQSETSVRPRPSAPRPVPERPRSEPARSESKNQPNTLFGEKLQAVLSLPD